MNNGFQHIDLKLIVPDFKSTLTDLIIELDYLRKKRLGGTTHPGIFFQLKHIFHTLESIGSARIEGNNTTIAEYIETKIGDEKIDNDSIREIQNMEKALEFIDDVIKDNLVNRAILSEIHKRVVEGLPPPPYGEGDHTPGQYRSINVEIKGSSHIPPEAVHVQGYMDELFAFLNENNEPKYDLLKVAMSHHRFAWIHPFRNGNGRTVRIFTYAMLVKLGFRVNVGRILNPTAVFCSDRSKYYQYLSLADSGKDEDMFKWCEYVLTGLKNEIEKIDLLLDYDYLKKKILYPAIHFARDRKLITEVESKILRRAADKQIIQSADLKDILRDKLSPEISRKIRKLIGNKMLMPEKEGKRKYLLRFNNNYLLRGIIKALDDEGFLPMQN